MRVRRDQTLFRDDTSKEKLKDESDRLITVRSAALVAGGGALVAIWRNILVEGDEITSIGGEEADNNKIIIIVLCSPVHLT